MAPTQCEKQYVKEMQICPTIEVQLMAGNAAIKINEMVA